MAGWTSGCGGDGSGAQSPAASAEPDGGEDVAAEVSACPWGELAGACLPEPPRGTPPDQCPSGKVGEGGICLPALPALTDWTCPPGWEAVAAWDADLETEQIPGGGLAPIDYCQPPEAPFTCPAGSFPVVGQTSCVRQGPECPSSPALWADEEALRARAPAFDGVVRYVAPGDGSEADGSRDHPFATLGAALQVAQDGDLIALAAGDYAETATVDHPVALVGACTEGTRLVALDAGPAPIVRLTGTAGALLTDLTVTGPRPGIQVRHAGDCALEAVAVVAAAAGPSIEIDSSGTVDLTDVLVTDVADGGAGVRVVSSHGVIDRTAVIRSRDYGLRAESEGTVVELSDTVIAFTTEGDSDSNGRGIDVRDGPRLQASRLLLAHNTDDGLAAFGAEVLLADAVVSNTQPGPPGMGDGRGLGPEGGTQLEGQRIALIGNRAAGLVALDPETEVNVTDLVVLDTQADVTTRRFGHAIAADNGAHVTAERAVLLRSHEAGVTTLDAGSAIALRDALVAETQPRASDGGGGRGLEVSHGARADLERVVLWRNRELGVFARYEGTELSMVDVVVSQTAANANAGTGGDGLEARTGALVTGQRVAFVGNHTAGVSGLDPGTALTLTDLLVTDTQPEPSDGAFGNALAVQDGAAASVERAAIARNRVVGVGAHGTGASLRLTDVSVADTEPPISGDSFGRGLEVAFGATLTAQRLDISGSVGFAAGVYFDGTTADLSDVRLAGTQVADVDGSPIGGSGLVIARNAQAAIRAFAIRDDELAGVQMSDGGQLAARDGVITSNVIGVAVADPNFDLQHAFVDVRSIDNDVSLDATDLPVPDTSSPLVGIDP